MSGIAGYGGMVLIGDVPTTVAGIENWSLDMAADDIDVTSFDSQGWRERIQGLKEWSGAFEGRFEPGDEEGQTALINAWLNGQPVKLELQVTSTIKFTGQAFINPSIETPVDDKVTFSCEFQGTGPLTPVLDTGS